MSYSISIKDSTTGKVAVIPSDVRTVDYPHTAVPQYGTNTTISIGPELTINVTYNFSRFLYRKELLGENGIRSLYGIPLSDAQEAILNCINELNRAIPTSDEWKCDDLPKDRETSQDGGFDYFLCCIYNVRNALLLMNDMIQMCKAIDPKKWNERLVFEGD